MSSRRGARLGWCSSGTTILQVGGMLVREQQGSACWVCCLTAQRAGGRLSSAPSQPNSSPPVLTTYVPLFLHCSAAPSSADLTVQETVEFAFRCQVGPQQREMLYSRLDAASRANVSSRQVLAAADSRLASAEGGGATQQVGGHHACTWDSLAGRLGRG